MCLNSFYFLDYLVSSVDNEAVCFREVVVVDMSREEEADFWNKSR